MDEDDALGWRSRMLELGDARRDRFLAARAPFDDRDARWQPLGRPQLVDTVRGGDDDSHIVIAEKIAELIEERGHGAPPRPELVASAVAASFNSVSEPP